MSARWKKIALVSTIAVVVLTAGALGMIRWMIVSGLDELCTIAQTAHPNPGDDTAALVDYVRTETHDLRERGRAVWALGQMRDPKALPVLESFYTGEECDHENHLCQDELHKAIQLCRGETPNLLCINRGN